MNISIKSVDEDGWRKVRMEAIKHDMNIGEFIIRAIGEHIAHEEEGHKCPVFHNKKGKCGRAR